MLKSRTRKLTAGLVFACGVFGQSYAQTLTDLKSKTGSEIVYGALQGYSSLNEGLAFILKKVHGHYGSKPELGTFFKSRTGESVGTFFNVDDKNFTHEKQSGLVLVSKLPDGSLQAAVLTDKESQFKTSVNGMLRKVQEAWYPAGAGKMAASAPVEPLETYSFPDGTGSLDLASGWRPLVARGGGAIAAGPHGETLGASCYLGVLDANSPRVRMQLSSGRPLPGLYAAAPSGLSPAETFGILYNQFRQKYRMSQGEVHVDVVKQQPDAGGTSFVLAGDFQDRQAGDQHIVAVMHASPVNPRLGGWGCIMSMVTAPSALFPKESSTLFAMVNSLKQNGAAIMRKSDEASQAIRDYGASVRRTAKEKSDAFDGYMASIDRQHDADDKQSASFADLQLGQAVVENTQTGEHKRFYNDDAYNLVQANPDKYQVVPGSQYVKDKDY